MMAFLNTMLIYWGCWLVGQQLGLLYVLMHDRKQMPDPWVMAAFLAQLGILPTLFGA